MGFSLQGSVTALSLLHYLAQFLCSKVRLQIMTQLKSGIVRLDSFVRQEYSGQICFISLGIVWPKGAFSLVYTLGEIMSTYNMGSWTGGQIQIICLFHKSFLINRIAHNRDLRSTFNNSVLKHTKSWMEDTFVYRTKANLWSYHLLEHQASAAVLLDGFFYFYFKLRYKQINKHILKSIL